MSSSRLALVGASQTTATANSVPALFAAAGLSATAARMLAASIISAALIIFAFAHPAPEGYAEAEIDPDAARWDAGLGEFVLDWEEIRSEPDPHRLALEFAHSAFQHSCATCGWDPSLAASAAGDPPPIN